MNAIELLMTLALALYVVAFLVAKYGKSFWAWHIPIAIFGFILDAWGTFLMSNIVDVNTNWIVILHTTLATLALCIVGVQMYFGAMMVQTEDHDTWLEYKKKHIWFAHYIFFPAWVLAYLSGFLFFFV